MACYIVRGVPSLGQALLRAQLYCVTLNLLARSKLAAILTLSRAIEHVVAGVRNGDSGSHNGGSPLPPLLLEPLIEHSAVVLANSGPSTATTPAQAVGLVLLALHRLRELAAAPDDGNAAATGARANAAAGARGRSRRICDATAVLCERDVLRLRTRALAVLAAALHQRNRISDPLEMQRRALALVLRACGDPCALCTVEPRAHICALAAARLYMLSDAGFTELSWAADQMLPQGLWKSTYGKGRPGRGSAFHNPVIARDCRHEVAQTAVCATLRPHPSLLHPAPYNFLQILSIYRPIR